MIRQTIALLQKVRQHYLPEEWSHPTNLDGAREPTFLFVFTPPYSGSTALAQILNSAHLSMMLTPNGEGQWLVPGLCGQDRWHPDKHVEWSSVRAVWMSRVRMVEDLVGRVDLVIEKSPPNLVRYTGLLEHFPQHQLIVFNRNPYANCASILFREFEGESRTEDDRIDVLRMLAMKWLFRSRYAKQIVDVQNPPWCTYEGFCKDAHATVKRLQQNVPLLEGICPDTKVRVKDYAPQRIADQNARQVAKLSAREKESIGRVLRDDEALLSFFGYTSDWELPVEQGGAGSTAHIVPDVAGMVK